MKLFFLLLTITSAWGNGKDIQFYLRSKMYLSALQEILSSPGINPNKKSLNLLARNLHPLTTSNITNLIKLKNITSDLDFHLWYQMTKMQRHEQADYYLNRIDSKSLYNAQKKYIIGMNLLKKKEYNLAAHSFIECARTSDRYKDVILDHSIKNRCIQYLSRILFTMKKFNAALAYLDLVKKTDSIWPRILLDQAWIYYWQKKYGMTLGKLITYKSPLLYRFITPEVYYLRTLSYFKLCNYKKAITTFENFSKEMKMHESEFETFFKVNSLQSFIKQKSSFPFVYSFFKGYKKEFKFTIYLESRKKLLLEAKRVNAVLKSKKHIGKHEHLKKVFPILKNAIRNLDQNYFTELKARAKDYVNRVNSVRVEMVKLNLLLRSKGRKSRLTDKNDHLNKFNKLSLYKIQGSQDKAIYEFLGGFWADEIGDYSFALKPSCGEGL